MGVGGRDRGLNLPHHLGSVSLFPSSLPDTSGLGPLPLFLVRCFGPGLIPHLPPSCFRCGPLHPPHFLPFNPTPLPPKTGWGGVSLHMAVAAAAGRRLCAATSQPPSRSPPFLLSSLPPLTPCQLLFSGGRSTRSRTGKGQGQHC